MTILVQQLRAEIEQLQAEIKRQGEELREFQAGAKAEADAGDEARADVRRLTQIIIHSEAGRIGSNLKRMMDQKQIDELVALGIQQDKDEIARLKAENAELKVKAARWQYVRHYGLPDRGRNKDGELVFRYFLWNETPWLPTAEEAIDQAMTKEQQS